MENNIFSEDLEQDFQLMDVIKKYLTHWRWFVLSAIVALCCAFVYLRYTLPSYSTSTTILIKDEKKGGDLSSLSAFSELGLAGGSKNIENEIEILKSRTLVANTVSKLKLNISLISKGNVIDTEVFDGAPIEVQFTTANGKAVSATMVFQIRGVSSSSFALEAEKDKESLFPISGSKKEFKYGEIIPTKFGNLVINNTSNLGSQLSKSEGLVCVINPLDAVVDSYRASLSVAQTSKTSNVLNLSIVGPVQKKSEVFLDNLVQTYNQNAIVDKNFISENTSKFINNRLAIITQELDGVEKNVENFKTSNKVTDIDSEAKIYIEGSSEYDKKGVEADIQLSVISSLLDFMKKSTNADLLPSNIMGEEGGSGGLIDSYNSLVLDRNRLLKSATPENPSVIKIDQQIVALKSNVKSSLLRLQSSLNIQKRNFKSNEGILNSKIGKIPSQERLFRVIARQQKVKEELYLYLLQKREETAITLAATEPNARVIDTARSNQGPVSPKKSIIYLGALVIGLLIPFGVVYVDDLLDTKVKSRLDLEGNTQIPFIGDLPTSDSPSEVIKLESRSSSAEALRIIRTNLEFLLNKSEDNKAKTIFLTSTFPKEGKTFVSANLAATFALSGKKVLLIGMDIRNPRLDEYFNLPEKGFTNYLSSKDLKLEDLIIKQSDFEDFHILPAGIVPPNPAELLMSKKVDTLFTELKGQYDYIIVDTAPVSLVTDTLLIAKHADCFIYVARANFLEKRMLSIPNTLYKEQKLPNMCLLLNDTDSTKGYGYGYGYGLKVKEQPWYKKIGMR